MRGGGVGSSFTGSCGAQSKIHPDRFNAFCDGHDFRGWVNASCMCMCMCVCVCVCVKENVWPHNKEEGRGA